MGNDPLPNKGHRRFVLSVLLPVLTAVVFTFAVVASLVYLSARKSDERAASREEILVRHFLDKQVDVLRQQQANVVGWDDALIAVEAPFDTDWIATNLGRELHENAGIDVVFLLDPNLEPVLAMYDGEHINTSNYTRYKSTFSPFVQRLREIDWQGALSAYTQGISHVLPAIGDVMTIDKRPALVSFMPVASDSGRFTYRPGSEFVHIAVQLLDNELAGMVNDSVLVTSGHFTDLRTPLNPDEISVPVLNRSNQVVTRFAWIPGRPSTGILSEGLPVMLMGFAITLAIVIWLVRRLHRSTSQIEASRAAAQHLAFHDKLTGLANRALFEDRLNHAVARARRGPDGIALLMIDLDRFKQVNDTLGHQAGDDLIRQVAERMRPLLRETDTISRLGGDEFAIILTDIRTSEDVTAVAARVIRSIAAPFEVAQSQAFVGASIGIALAPGDALASVELIRKADIALYEAKSGGRNQFKVFEDRMSETVRRRQTIEEELRSALTLSDGLSVEYVPFVHGNGAKIDGVTAEIVWKHPTLGMIDRDRFIPVAEGSGLIEPIASFLLQSACEFGANRPGLRVGVRIYSAQLRNPSFLEKLFITLDDTGMQPEDLELEIDQKTISDEDPAIVDTIEKLNDVGIRLALADFGSNFRALILLQKFKVSRINIESGFFNRLKDSPDPDAITDALVSVADAIGVEVSAEGVDTAERQNMLHEMGVTSFQGAVFTPEAQAQLLRQTFERVTGQTQSNAPESSAATGS